MINKTVQIKIGNVGYNASFNFGVIKNMQNKIKGLKVEDIFKGVENQDFNIITNLLYFSIKCNHPNFDISEIDRLGLNDLDTVFEGIAELFGLSLPDSSEIEDIEEKN